MSANWTKSGLVTINNIKKSILKKKILLNIIIDNYSKYDKIFRYCHITIAAVTPLLLVISKIVQEFTNNDENATLILSSIVAIMIKAKDYLKFDKIKDIAKQQTIKYEQLFQRIEREMMKPADKRQNEEELIYWINREYSNIEMTDPDISRSIKDKYMHFCKENNIPCNEDLNVLQELITSTVEIIIDKEQNVLVAKETEEKEITVIDHTASDSIVDNDTIPDNNNAVIDSNTILDNNTIPDNRPRNTSEDKKEYRTKIQTLDTRKDLEWAMERLGSLE
jgi:hypothetical protein